MTVLGAASFPPPRPSPKKDTSRLFGLAFYHIREIILIWSQSYSTLKSYYGMKDVPSKIHMLKS